jgi:hypothetical protein
MRNCASGNDDNVELAARRTVTPPSNRATTDRYLGLICIAISAMLSVAALRCGYLCDAIPDQRSGGSMIVLPGNTSHFRWAKSGEYVTQVTAIGPLGLEYLDPADDPRKLRREP